MNRLTKTVCLLLACVIGLPIAVLANAESERLFFQAEAMTTDSDTWTVGEHFYNWYAGVPLENMLDGSKGGAGQAVQELTVPVAGIRRLWVRYIDYTPYRGPFRLTVLQDDVVCAEKVFDLNSLRVDDAGLTKWGGGFGQFVWDYLDVPLSAGSVKVVLSKEEPIHVSWLARRIDCFVLAADLEYEPKENDFVAPLWARVTVGEAHPQPSTISIFGRRALAPWYTAFSQLGRDGLETRHYPRPESFLAPGEVSPWVDIAPLLTTRGQNNMQFMAMVQYPVPVEGADFELLFASEPTEAAVIARFQRSGTGGGLLVTIDLSRRDEIRSEVSWSRDALAAARAVETPIGRRARRFPLLTALALSPRVNVQETVSNELEVLTRLGFSGLSPNPAFVERGFMHPYSGQFYYHLLGEHACFSAPQRERIRSALTTTAEQLIADGLEDNVAFLDLMDEPWSASLEHLTTCEACKAGFRVFLRDRKHVSLEHLGCQTWDQVAPTADQKKARLYYWTARFRHQLAADFFKIGTDILQELIPGVRTCANYGEDLRYGGNMLSSGVDWFLIQNEAALTYGWTEDWCNFAVSSQLTGYHADFLRAACRARGQSFGMYTILGERTAWDIQAKAVSKIGHGAQATHYFNYGPTYAITSDQNSHRHEIYPALAKVNHAIGAVEDYIMDGHVLTGRVAMLYSHSSDIWTQEASSTFYGKERQNIWLLLRHLGYTPEIITEAEVQAGGLTDYDWVFVHDSHLETKAGTALVDWVRAGGTLYLGSGSAMFDHYNEPLDLDTRLGIARGAFTLSQLPGEQDVYSLPSLTVLATVKSGDETLEAISGLQEQTVWAGASVMLDFTDETPAMVSGPAGKGTVITSGFFPGLGYARGGVAALANGDATITVNPPSYPAGYRTLFAEMLGETVQRDPVTTSHYLVEAGVLKSPHGLLITLTNWSGTPVKNVEVRVRADAKLGKPAAVLAPIQSIRRDGDELVLTLNVDAFEFIVISRK